MGIKTNLVMLSGFVMQDPSRDQTRSGKPMTRLTIRHQDSYEKPDGGKVNTSHMHTIALFGRQSEYADNTITAGMTVQVQGHFQTVTDRKGTTATYIVADAIAIVYTPKQAGALC